MRLYEAYLKALDEDLAFVDRPYSWLMPFFRLCNLLYAWFQLAIVMEKKEGNKERSDSNETQVAKVENKTGKGFDVFDVIDSVVKFETKVDAKIDDYFESFADKIFFPKPKGKVSEKSTQNKPNNMNLKDVKATTVQGASSSVFSSGVLTSESQNEQQIYTRLPPLNEWSATSYSKDPPPYSEHNSSSSYDPMPLNDDQFSSYYGSPYPTNSISDIPLLDASASGNSQSLENISEPKKKIGLRRRVTKTIKSFKPFSKKS